MSAGHRTYSSETRLPHLSSHQLGKSSRTNCALLYISKRMRICMHVWWWLSGLEFDTLDCGSRVHRFKIHQPLLEKKYFLCLAPNPGPSKNIQLGTWLRLGMDNTTGCASSHFWQVGPSLCQNSDHIVSASLSSHTPSSLKWDPGHGEGESPGSIFCVRMYAYGI